MPYDTQYSPWMDAAGAVQGPANSMMRTLQAMPQQRAQARLMDSQFRENEARTGLLQDQRLQLPLEGELLKARTATEGAQGSNFMAQAGLHTQQTEQLKLAAGIAQGLSKLSGAAAQEIASGTNGPNAQQFMGLLMQIQALEGGREMMPSFAQGVNLIKAGGDPVGLANAQAGGRGIPFNRSVGPATTPFTLPAGGAAFGPMQPGQTNAPATAVNPQAFNPAGRASVDAATINARARVLQEAIRQLGDLGADPAEVQRLMQQSLQEFKMPQAGPMALSSAPATNAPAVRRYNPATGKIE